MHSKTITDITIYSIFHALVDFCCAAIVYSYVGKIDVEELLKIVLLYNGIAFGIQPIIGFISDKTGFVRNYAITGCGIIAFSFLFLKMPFVAVSVAALGNAFYHIGGGSAILKISEGKSLLSGIFVAPGAIGLFFGAFLWKIPSFKLFWLSGLMIAGMIIISPFLVSLMNFETTFAAWTSSPNPKAIADGPFKRSSMISKFVPLEAILQSVFFVTV